MKSKRQNLNSTTKPKKEPKLSRTHAPAIFRRWTGNAACAASSAASRPSGLKI